MGRSQREKGKRGERQAAKAVQEATGLPARRGVQYQGGPESADIDVECHGMHWEVKFVERESVRAWMEQAVQDSGGKVPVVLHRRKGKEWLLTIQLGRLNDFARRMAAAMDAQIPQVGPAELPG